VIDEQQEQNQGKEIGAVTALDVLHSLKPFFQEYDLEVLDPVARALDYPAGAGLRRSPATALVIRAVWSPAHHVVSTAVGRAAPTLAAAQPVVHPSRFGVAHAPKGAATMVTLNTLKGAPCNP